MDEKMMLRTWLRVPFLWLAVWIVLPQCYATAAYISRALIATACRHPPGPVLVSSVVSRKRFFGTAHHHHCYICDDNRSTPSASRTFLLGFASAKENEYQDDDSYSVENLASEWALRNTDRTTSPTITEGTSLPALPPAAEAPDSSLSWSSSTNPLTPVSMEKLAQEWSGRNREQPPALKQPQQAPVRDEQTVASPILQVKGSDLRANTAHEIPPILNMPSVSATTTPPYIESSSSLNPLTTKPTSSPSPSPPLPPPTPSSQGSKARNRSASTSSKTSSLLPTAKIEPEFDKNASLQDLAKIWRVMNIDKSDEQLAARKNVRCNNLIFPIHHPNKSSRDRQHRRRRRRPVFIDTLGYKEEDAS
jgi:hypothetical protein